MELIHSNMRGLVEESLGQLGAKYFPFVLSIFTMLAVLNLLGLCPYVFTPTVHIAMTLGIAVSVMVGVTVLGVRKFGLNYLSILVPGGIPLVISPFLIIVETASYLIRAISLGVRLAANISAGHLLFSILATFAFNLWMKGFTWLGWGAAVGYLAVDIRKPWISGLFSPLPPTKIDLGVRLVQTMQASSFEASLSNNCIIIAAKSYL